MTVLLIVRLFLLAFAAGFAALAIGIQVRWWRLCRTGRWKGRVVDQILDSAPDGGTYYHPVIQVAHGVDLVRFQSSYARSKAFSVGEEITVAWDPKTQKAEWHTATNRYLASAGLAGVALVFGAVAICIRA
jgi:hypothetical protein